MYSDEDELFSERDEILANTKVMMEMVCEMDSLDRDLQDSITELNIISGADADCHCRE